MQVLLLIEGFLELEYILSMILSCHLLYIIRYWKLPSCLFFKPYIYIYIYIKALKLDIPTIFISYASQIVGTLKVLVISNGFEKVFYVINIPQSLLKTAHSLKASLRVTLYIVQHFSSNSNESQINDDEYPQRRHQNTKHK